MKSWSDALVKLFIFVVLFYTITAAIHEYRLYLLAAVLMMAGIWIAKRVFKHVNYDRDHLRR